MRSAEKMLAMIATVLGLSMSAMAYTETVGGVTWTYTVSGEGASIGGSSWATGAITIPSSLGGSPVTSIGSYAFYNHNSITSVTIPDSVTSIGYNAFYKCTNLTSVTIPTSVTSIWAGALDGTTFYDNLPDGLVVLGKVAYKMKGVSPANVTIQDGVVSISNGAFSGCSGLTSVTIPNSVTSIGDSAFSGCTGLTDVTIPGSVTSIGDSAFSGCIGLTSVTIPDNITRIGSGMFSGCTGLTNVTIPDSVTSIGNNAFTDTPFYDKLPDELVILGKVAFKMKDANQTSVIVPEGVISISHFAFSGCSGLKSVTIPDSVMSIGSYAFSGCTGLTNVTIPEGVTSIESNMFEGCSGLTSVTIPDSVTDIWNYAFAECSGLTSIIIPDSATNIGDYAFYNCNGLTSLTIPDTVMSIGEYAFYGCSGLTNVTLPSNWTSIGDYAFYGCRGLTSLTIPDGVISIGEYAFYGCSGLTNITLPSNGISIGNYAFCNCRGLTSLTIPDGVGGIGEWAFDGEHLQSITISQNLCGGALYRALYGSLGNAPNVLKTINIVGDVTSIGDYAFAGLSSVEQISIPNSVEHIGNYAFGGCSSITSIVLPAGLTEIGYGAFAGCSGLTSLEIPESVETIGSMAFFGCTGLAGGGDTIRIRDVIYQYTGTDKDLVLSDCRISSQAFYGRIFDNITLQGCDVDPYAFAACDITNLVLSSSALGNIGTYTQSAFYQCNICNVTIGDVYYEGGSDYGLFAYCYNSQYDHTSATISQEVCSQPYMLRGCSVNDLIISEGTTYIADDAYFNCEKVVLPDGLIEIGSHAFSGLTQDFEIPNSVERIGDYAFAECRATSLAIPDSVTSIGAYAFEYGGYTNITIGSGVSSIGDFAFYCCSSLEDIAVSEENEYYSSVNGLLLTKDGKTLLQGVKGDVLVPDGVTEICSGAFYGLYPLSVYIPPSIETIGRHAFGGYDGSAGIDIYIPETLSTSSSHISDSRVHLYKYSPQQTVTLDAGGGIVSPAELQVEYRGVYGELPTPTREGYTFNEWRIDDESVDADTLVLARKNHTLTANWTINRHTVTFDANGGSGGSTGEFDYGEEIVVPEVSKEGYAFSGWDKEVAATVPDEDLTYTAQWTPNKYTVTFDDNGGDGGTSGLQDYGTAIVPPTVTKTGYDFAGWEPEVAATVPANNVTYTAKWTVHTYRVGLELDGGSCEISELGIDYLAAIGELPVPTKEGVEFIGWWTEPEGGERVDESLVITEDTAIYAHWLYEVAAPAITPGDGAVFRVGNCMVSMACETEGARIYYSTNGKTPKLNDNYLYTGEFCITDTSTIKAVATYGALKSDYVTVTITKVPLALAEAIEASEDMAVTTSADEPWVALMDESAKVDGSFAKSAEIGNDENTWIAVEVAGPGELTFWNRTSCEHDEDNTFTWDRLMVFTNEVEILEWRMDGESAWTQRSVRFSGGENMVKWVYCKDESDFDGEDCAWVDGLSWTPLAPSVKEDDGAEVTGDAESGFMVKPSAENTNVEVTIPEGVSAEKVTVQVGTEVESVKANGATIKVVKGEYDITEHLEIPAADESGVIDMTKAEVKKSVADEAMDKANGADVNLEDAEKPAITTSATKPGLKYTLREGRSLETMKDGDHTDGDGQPWTPTISIKGGDSAFYTIKVEMR